MQCHMTLAGDPVNHSGKVTSRLCNKEAANIRRFREVKSLAFQFDDTIVWDTTVCASLSHLGLVITFLPSPSLRSQLSCCRPDCPRKHCPSNRSCFPTCQKKGFRLLPRLFPRFAERLQRLHVCQTRCRVPALRGGARDPVVPDLMRGFRTL
jgi:hypothetical protein